MNNIPSNNDSDIIRSILSESIIRDTITKEQLLNEGWKWDQLLNLLKGLGKRAFRRGEEFPTAPRSPYPQWDPRIVTPPGLPGPRALPPAPETGLARTGTGKPETGLAMPGTPEWSPIPRDNTGSKYGVKDILTALGLGTLGYYGYKTANRGGDATPGTEPFVIPQEDEKGPKISPTSASGITDPSKPWVPEQPEPKETPELALSTPSLTNYGIPAPKSTAEIAATALEPATSEKPSAVPAPIIPFDGAGVRPSVAGTKRAEAEEIAANTPAIDTSAAPEEPKVQRTAAKSRTAQYDELDAALEELRRAKQSLAKAHEIYGAPPAERTKDGGPGSGRDVNNIVPGSQMWGELSLSEKQAIRDRYAKGEGPSLSLRYNKETGKFDEPGYGDQGHYGDIVKALNVVNEQYSVQQYCDFLTQKLLKEELGINRKAYAKRGKGPKAVRAAKESLASGGWSGDSSTVEDLPPHERMSRKGGVDAAAFVKSKVIDIMGAAQKKGIQMTTGEAQRIATQMLKQHMGQA